MTAAQLLPIVLLAVPAAGLVLWPLLRGAGAGRERPETALGSSSGATDRRLELGEERTAIYRALRELDFDHEAGHLSEDDYRGLRDAYEARAATVLGALDALGPLAPPQTPAPRADGPRAAARAAAGGRGWTHRPVALGVGAVLLLAFGVLLGVSVGRYTEPDPMAPAPGGVVAAPGSPGAMGGPALPSGPGSPAGPAMPGGAASPGGPVSPGDPTGAGPARPLSPEMLAGMLEAARQSLFAGRYSEAIAAYQAVLKRDPRNVNAMSHLGYIVALGGHADAALETFDKALAIDPNYPPAHFFRGQVLAEAKGDYAGAARAWERFLVLVPRGAEHDQVKTLLAEARAKA
ncbi:MAG TPA: tetratricopeptide repeat protein, partial [Pseudomonadales bacterium]|nr:tetratricopeptide repeat protein [Pseudomonadales bacterium]